VLYPKLKIIIRYT